MKSRLLIILTISIMYVIITNPVMAQENGDVYDKSTFQNGSVFPHGYQPLYVESPLKQIKSGVSLIDVTCNEGKVKVIKYNRMMVACVNGNTEAETKLIDRGWALLRFAMPEMTIPEINHLLCNSYEGKWHPEYDGCRDITDLQCSLMGGEFVDNLKICYNEICPMDKTYTLCVTNSDLISGEKENEK